MIVLWLFFFTQILYHIAKTPGTFPESLAISYWDFFNSPNIFALKQNALYLDCAGTPSL